MAGSEVSPFAWENSFQWLAPGDHAGPDGMWAVMDAECEEILYYCRTEEQAAFLAKLLSDTWAAKRRRSAGRIRDVSLLGSKELPVSQTGAGEDASQATPPVATGVATQTLRDVASVPEALAFDRLARDVIANKRALLRRRPGPRCESIHQGTATVIHEMPGAGVAEVWPVVFRCEMPEAHEGQHFSTVPSGFFESGYEYTWPEEST